MPVSSDIKKLEQEILDTIGHYENDVPKQLAVLVSDIQAELKAGNFKNRTGALRRSIRVKLIDSDISISMKAYGYYLSFGVSGKNRSNVVGLPNEVATAFGVKEGYKFGSNKVWGIDARKFYPLDIEDRIIKILEEDA